MSSKRLDSIADYAGHRFRLRVDCLGCKRLAIIEPRVIVEMYSKRGWSRDMQAVERGCGVRLAARMMSGAVLCLGISTLI